MSNSLDIEKLMSIQSAAAYAGVSRGTIYRWINQGVIYYEDDTEFVQTLPYVLVDDITFLDQDDLDEYVELLEEIGLR